MSWWRKRDDSDLTADEVQKVLLADARAKDYSSRLWDREHSPAGSDGNWSNEAWRNNAQLMRAADEAIAEGAESFGDDAEEVLDDLRRTWWWWDQKYD